MYHFQKCKMTYETFLEQKRHTTGDFGIRPINIPSSMFDFQQYIAEKNIVKGRQAGFVDTGLGKTIVELVVADNYARSTNKPVLILTPLAVAYQFIEEAKKFGIGDIEYSRDGKYKSKIVVANYERLHHFDWKDFECVILDESSILKNFKGAIKNSITSFIKKVRYRFLYTATPAPNDYVELGTSSEALGYLGYTDMLTKFFTNNEDTISPMNIGTEWILKGHAKEAFFQWVRSWALIMRMPSDHGFSDARHVLPKLITNFNSVKNEENMIVNGQILMFNMVAQRQSEVASENKLTIQKRCERAVELAAPHDTSVYWCNLNPEGDLLELLDKNAVQLSGGMPLERKEEILLAFQKGEIKKLITKAKITAFGLNWQHCNHTVYFPTWSYEQYYQALRRFLRYGQQRDVIADLVYSDGQKRVIDSILAKTQKANELFSVLNKNTNTDFSIKAKGFDKNIVLPNFLKAS